nr:putative ribonuclease H-like domain-containing protein [Tanacetum cinerariifolium]
YSVVPPPPTQIYSSPKKDMSWNGLPEFKDDIVTDYSRPEPTVESISDDAQNRNPFVTKEASPSTISPKSFIKFVKENDSPTTIKIDKAKTAKKPPVRKFPTGGTKFSTADMGKKGKAVKPSALTNDFSGFTWTFFLKTKDETSGILKKFITEIENLKDLKVKIIRCDNGGEFRNKEMNDFCSQKWIKREFSNARTPQQNGIAERRNMTLIEAARIMLADAKLPVTFWVEAVNTACYVQNRVLVNKSQNKTPRRDEEKKRLDHLKQDQTILVIKRFSERKKVFRERKKTGKIHAKRKGTSVVRVGRDRDAEKGGDGKNFVTFSVSGPMRIDFDEMII